MKFPRLAFAAVAVILWVAASISTASDQTTVETDGSGMSMATPVAVIPQLSHTFEAVVDGMEVTHDFAIQNTGDAPLAIQRVKTG
jgi:hypothetical protein